MSRDSLILGSLSDCVGNKLSLKSVVKLPQCLLFTDGILAAESRLFPIAIRLSLLFLYPLFHVSEHLKELIFVLLR